MITTIPARYAGASDNEFCMEFEDQQKTDCTAKVSQNWIIRLGEIERNISSLDG